MKLTSSFQLLAQQYLGNTGYGNVYIRTYGRVSSQGYDIANNRTLVYIEARIYTEGGYWYSSSGTTYSISFSGSNSSGAISCNGQFNAGETVLGTLSGYVTHNNDGTRTIHAECNFTSSPWGWNATASVNDVTLPTIPRQATIKTAPDFNDEENPTITYSNPAGNAVTTLQACISFTGSTDDIKYRDISKTGSSYTFDLTEEERKILRAGTTSNSRTLKFYVKTVIGGNTYYSILTKNFTIINATPIFENFDFADINPQTVRLLEGEDATTSQSIILGYSNVKVTIPVANKAIAQKEATMNLYRFNNIEEKYSDIEDVSIISNNVPSGEFKVYAIDSRNNAKEQIKSASRVVNYTPLLKKQDLVAKRENGVSEKVEISFSGVVDLVNFGAITNSIKLAQYRYKVASSNEWSEYSELELTIDETGNFSFNNLIKGPTESLGFDINDAYNIEVYIEDELSQITYTANLGSGVPHIAYAKNGVGIMGKYDESVGGLLQVGGKSITNSDTLPIGTIVNYDGNDVPDGYEEVEDYSTNETEIGTWIDLKPRYRKVIVSTGNTGNNVSIPHNISNLKAVTKVTIFATNNRGTNYHDESVDYPLYVNVIDPNNIFANISSGFGIGWTVYIILEYTKTTD